MPAALTLTTTPSGQPRTGPGDLPGALVAVYRSATEPPEMIRVAATGPAELIEDLFTTVAAVARVPLPALREVIENLVHARFAGALVSVVAGGRVVRVTDAGPGIPDVDRALQHGFTTADGHLRRVVRGVGSGLPLAHELMRACGGRLEIAAGLAGGAVVTLSAPGDEPAPAPSLPGELERTTMALLLEIGSADPGRVARELGRELPECGRALVQLEHRGLVSRDDAGQRSLTEAGTALVATLF